MPVRRPPGYWTQERALETLRQLVAEGFDISKTAKLKPAIFSGVASAFGSFRKACEVAGIEYNVPERVRLNMGATELQETLRKHAVAGTVGRILLDRVYVGAFNRKFAGRLKGAFQSAGLEVPDCLDRSYTMEEIAEYLTQYARVEGGVVPVKRLTTKARRAIRRYYGTLAEAEAQLGIRLEGENSDLPELKPRGRAAWKGTVSRKGEKKKEARTSNRHPPGYWTSERVIEMTRQRLTSGPPFSLKNREDRKLYAAARARFGSFEEAARIAGVSYTPERTRRSRKKDQYDREQLTKLVREWAREGQLDLSSMQGWLQTNLERQFGNLQRAADEIGVVLISREGLTITPSTSRHKS